MSGACRVPTTGLGTFMKIKAFIISLLLLLTVIVLFQNTDAVLLRLLFWEFNLSGVICLLTTFITGDAVGYLENALRNK